MKAILGNAEGLTERRTAPKRVADEEAKEERKQSDSEDEIAKEMATHGRLPNLSFFAFTATPKAKTLEMFGTPDANGIPHAFHIYSMKQAIQEGFILDVLKNYVVFANERALMVYGRQEKRLLAALDLQAMDCNYFNTDSIHTRVLLQKDTIYIFNEKKEQQPTQMYVYDLKKTDVSSALSVTEDVRKLELVYREWKTFSAENSLDTFSGMADGDYWNSLINFGKDGKETGVYSQQCIVWTDRAGRQYRSALVIIGGDDYELYSCPADDTEKISEGKAFGTDVF